MPEGAATATKVAWDELSQDEKTALKRLNRGPYPDLADETGARLIRLGLAAARPEGIGISRAGRELVIDTLLQARPSVSDRS
ncbi:hypothetical protein KEU06_07525 [Pseudaminobacter sp. 19-2017]|uniref:Uncharacterized protein n=1 Tax=Pseudaminobacter soli (ex Zhang et al. 2022) TaxID=2831468 RepID=A0A942DZY3_9HYPH|nr:hypothetical protein [Pseudaminobacter soli]MBS3648476.1 hypothetical protein [Pseudaminobacter soli]